MDVSKEGRFEEFEAGLVEFRVKSGRDQFLLRVRLRVLCVQSRRQRHRRLHGSVKVSPPPTREKSPYRDCIAALPRARVDGGGCHAREGAVLV